jgi:periplasmic glucans biosynthesis protein
VRVSALVNRRSFLALSASSLLVLHDSVRAAVAQSSASLTFGHPQAYNFQRVIEFARTLAAQPYVQPRAPASGLINSIDFDAAQGIKFRKPCALWQDQSLPVRFFHLNKFVGLPVSIYAVDGDVAREIVYSKQCFDYGNAELARRLPDDLGFAGFRVMDGPELDTDWLAFQGASYFRSSGSSGQYGSSARGIAIDTAMPKPEEFPRFSRFWIESEDANNNTISISALLEGPSITGAYRFVSRRGQNVVMDVETHLFTRADIARLGLAPLTSMYWYGENSVVRRPDWRPEIHDCDGLAIWTGVGERIWRPLINPPQVLTNSFIDHDPKGFGLLQRDRNFNDYQDDGAFYNRRPSIWVEPLTAWGEGAVQLVQIPTTQEIDDNVVAYWTPKKPVRKGEALSLKYRLYWADDEPYPPGLARVVATRIGRGGVPGQPIPSGEKWKFVIDWEGGPLARMERRYDVEPVVSLSAGRVERPYVIEVVDTSQWRSFFDVKTDNTDPLELRCYLRLDEKPLSETWTYQFFRPTQVPKLTSN